MKLSSTTSFVYPLLLLVILCCGRIENTAAVNCALGDDDWCMRYKSNYAVFDSDPNNPDITFTFDAPEPADDGDLSKFYKVKILDTTCSYFVTESTIYLADAYAYGGTANSDGSGVVKKSKGYSATDQTISFGLDIGRDSPVFAASPFVTETADQYQIKFCVRLELLTTLDIEGQTPIGVAMKDISYTLVADKTFEQVFTIEVNAESEETGTGGGNANGNGNGRTKKGKPVGKGKDANGNDIPGVTGGGLFGKLQKALNDGHKIEVNYDPEVGIPIYFRIQKGSPASEETITITKLQNFKKTAPPPPTRRLQISEPDYSEITADQTLQQQMLTEADATFAESGTDNYEFDLYEAGAEAGPADAYPHSYTVETPEYFVFEFFLGDGVTLEAYLCNDANEPIPDVLFKPGQLVTLCVTGTPSDFVEVRNLQSVSFGNANDPDLAIPIINENSQEVGVQTSLNCANGICRVTAVTVVRMYEKVDADTGTLIDIAGGAKIAGTVIFGFVRRNLATTGEERNKKMIRGSTGRILQEEGGEAAAGFDLSLDLARPPPRGRAGAGESSSAVTTGSFVASTMMAILGIGYLLV